MKKWIGLMLALLLALSVQAGATEATPTEIHTPQDLAAIAVDPAGSYILMEDLDMAGEQWPAVDFSGSFDGNGHAILNLTLTEFGTQKPESYDGNRKAYETAYVGLFSTMQNAQVKNLKLLNVRAVIESDEPCFLAGIAGYAQNSTITDCTVSGVLELRAHDRMFGVGGLVGYGSGSVERCNADVTLICTDTDEATRDEQFLGGIYATGFMDVKDCLVAIDGYVSEHGYAHNGGVTGMYMEYPFGQGKKGYVTGNTVTGKITFFENNTNRRAYCEAVKRWSPATFWTITSRNSSGMSAGNMTKNCARRCVIIPHIPRRSPHPDAIPMVISAMNAKAVATRIKTSIWYLTIR